MSVIQNYLLRRPADGVRVPQKDGNHCGHYSQNLRPHVLSCSAVDARKGAEDYASVSELLIDIYI